MFFDLQLACLTLATLSPRYQGTLAYRNFRVGGIRFVRLGRLQLSFCIVRNSKKGE